MARRVWANGSEGGTPINAANLNGMEDDIEAALSYRLTMGTIDTGQASATLGPRESDNTQRLNLTLPPLDSYGWMVACFLDNGAAGEKLNLFYSPDGKTIFGGQNGPYYSPDRLRDPSIIYWQGQFFCAYTLDDGAGRNFRIIKSTTGAPGSWTVVATPSVSALVPTGNKCWAPELVVNGNDVYVFFTNTGTSTQTMGWMRATNTALTAWTAPVALATTGFSSNYIDGVPIQYGSDWYFFSSGGSQIYRAKSTSGITGPYTQDKSGDWAGWGTGIEGPYVTKIGNVYRIYFDRYVANSGHWYSESTDLTTWTAPQPVVSAPYTLPAGTKIRHGSFLQLPNADAAFKAIAATMSPSGPNYSVWSYSKSLANNTMTNMGAATIAVDATSNLSSPDANGNIYVVQGGLYMITCDAQVLSAITGASRTLVNIEDGAGGRYARFVMGGEGEDVWTSSALISLPQNGRLLINAMHTQGVAKTMNVQLRLARLGAN